MNLAPEPTAARVALWRALHAEIDAPPHVLDDRIGLQLLAPGDGWRARGDMDPDFTRPFRASIVARARFIEDLVIGQAARGLAQYVILGAGLDSFAQRRADIAPRLTIFEVDQPAPQAWKRERLIEAGFGVPDRLRFVPVDFEAGERWRDTLVQHGFDASQPAVVVSTGVSMYLTREANLAAMREVASLALGSTLAMTFLLPIDMAAPDVRPGLEMAEKGARASGTPFISFFMPDEIRAMALDAGFATAHHVSADELTARYFADRANGLRPPANAEELLIASISADRQTPPAQSSP
ncbi:O-Methyltransferase involved in polyketide biosynthesis [Candidatus Burkholderia verschuerenii]|uniref:S-adenosyl-L-methionine-dependent methyltransferase n=1 Tax=Candidatus Burkholderia verschuerenii TaxID=242163 RepID=A0A0L0MFS4_9BURK|nr:class I SAM-dependent methyltransferase [Candidatus Burkholderia verschuerenii]KND61547.1 O-Methyltransferase involved in polyketide biosynthesis [Candidatus Burkholderia verschuerenii]